MHALLRRSRLSITSHIHCQWDFTRTHLQIYCVLINFTMLSWLTGWTERQHFASVTRLPNLLCLRLKSRYSISSATRVVLPPRLCSLAYTCIDVGYVPSCKYLATLAAATWLNTVLSPAPGERGWTAYCTSFRNSTGLRRGYAREWFAAVKTVQS